MFICSIEYWFRCLDVDGDGVLSLYELQLFYEEVLQRLRELSIECLSVENTVCQVLDMVNPRLKSEWGERGREGRGRVGGREERREREGGKKREKGREEGEGYRWNLKREQR